MPVPLPDKATLDAVRQRAEEDRAFWSACRAELTKLYPDEFVAARDGKIVDHDKDLMALARRLQHAGIRSSDVSIERLAASPELFLL
jgi:hypothetical protein